MVYADSSFIVSLLLPDAATTEVKSVYWMLRRPKLVFSALHEMEVRNSFRVNEFVQKRNFAVKLHPEMVMRRTQAERRLKVLLQRGALRPVVSSWHGITQRFADLSERYTVELGCRTLDILHVAFALELRCRDFITCDVRQSELAKREGLSVRLVAIPTL